MHSHLGESNVICVPLVWLPSISEISPVLMLDEETADILGSAAERARQVPGLREGKDSFRSKSFLVVLLKVEIPLISPDLRFWLCLSKISWVFWFPGLVFHSSYPIWNFRKTEAMITRKNKIVNNIGSFLCGTWRKILLPFADSICHNFSQCF